MARTPVATNRDLHKFAAAKAGDALYSEQATTHILRWLTQLPDPDETLRKLGRNRTILRALEADDEISQCLDTRREAIIGTAWRLEPQQSRASRFLADQIAPHLEDLVRGTFSAVCYGYSVIEVVYSDIGGRVGIGMVSEKPQEWFRPQQDGTVRYFPDDGSGGVTGLDVDPRKFLVTRRQPSYRNPYGEALLSRLYWPFYFKTQGRRFWAQFLERFGFPILVGQVSDGQAFVDAMTKLGAVSPIAIPPGSSVDAIAATQAGEFERFENTFTRSIQKVILGQTLTSDVGSSGSYAAAKVHDAVRMDKRNADIRLVSATVQRLIDTLADLNGLQAPQFVMADGTGLEVERAQRDALLQEKGVLKLTEQYLLDRYDFTPGDFEIQASPSAPETPNGQGQAQQAAAEKVLTFGPPTFTPQQQAIEDNVAAMLDRLGSDIADAEIKAAIRSAESPQQLTELLAELLRNADPSATQRTIERALFAADIMGYAHAGGSQ